MKKRIFALSLLITITAIIIYVLISAQIGYNIALNKDKECLKIYSNFYNQNIQFNQDEAKNLSIKLDGARVTFMDKTGKVVADSHTKSINSSYKNREEVELAIKNNEGYAVRKSAELNKSMIYYCKKIDNGLLRISIYTTTQSSILVKSLPTTAWVFAIDIILCVIFTFFATGYVLKPVEKLAKNFSKSDINETKYKELKPLVDIFNRKNKEISRQVTLIEEENKLVKEAQNSKNEFISNITHEMNTPLTSIRGFAELLDEGKMSEQMQKKAIKTIISQSERLTNLIACIINYNEINNDELPSYDVDISAIAVDTIDTLMPFFKQHNVTVETDIDEGVMLSSRQERISEIMGNLIRNATKYNKPNGKIIVTIKGGSKKYLQVEDTGIGIAKENLDKIFSRFFTVDKSHNGKNGGFGLGLAVVKKLCKKAGWKLSVESELNVGTTFRINFN